MTRPARLDTLTVVDVVTAATVRSSPDELKWNPADEAQLVSEGRTATMPATDDTFTVVDPPATTVIRSALFTLSATAMPLFEESKTRESV